MCTNRYRSNNITIVKHDRHRCSRSGCEIYTCGIFASLNSHNMVPDDLSVYAVVNNI